MGASPGRGRSSALLCETQPQGERKDVEARCHVASPQGSELAMQAVQWTNSTTSTSLVRPAMAWRGQRQLRRLWQQKWQQRWQQMFAPTTLLVSCCNPAAAALQLADAVHEPVRESVRWVRGLAMQARRVSGGLQWHRHQVRCTAAYGSHLQRRRRSPTPCCPVGLQVVHVVVRVDDVHGGGPNLWTKRWQCQG